jgi:amino acid transporter
MNRLGIPVLPSIVNALIFISVFSTGNAAVFATSRAIHALSLRGGAPAIFKRQNRNGVPYVAVITVLLYSCISYLSVSEGSVKVLTWFTSIVGGANLVNWLCIAMYVLKSAPRLTSSTYLRFRAGLRAQGLLNNNFLPARGYLQPFSGYWLLCWAPVVFICR